MRIVVCVKHVPDIESDRSFDSGRVVRGSASGSLNELDEHPIEEALRILDRLDESERATSELVVLTVGPPAAADALKRAFQLGADVGILVSDDALAGSDYFGTAKAIAQAVRKVSERGPVDLVLTGMAALDGLGSVTPTLVAAELSWPQLTNAAALHLNPESARVERVVDGVTEVLEAPLPALVSVTDHINRARMPNFKLIMAARTKQIETWTLADLGLDAQLVGHAGARIRVLDAKPRPEREPVVLITDDGDGSGGRALAEFIINTELI